MADKTIQVEWKASPASGVTEIDISDLVSKTTNWVSLPEKKQKELINQWLKDNEEKIVAKAIEWS